MWPLLFFLFAVTIFMVPLIPALRELLQPTDIDPLNIEYDHDRNIRRFAQKFSQLSRAHLHSFSMPDHQDGKAISTHRKGPGVILVAAGCPVQLSDDEYRQRKTNRELVAERNIDLPDHFNFLRGVYAAGDIRSGTENRFQALLAEGDAALGANSEVLRWLHAVHVHVGHKAALYGRASAEEEIHFLGAARFERVNAPRIFFGEVNRHSVAVATARIAALDQIGAMVDHRPDEGRIIAHGDLVLPAHSVLQGNLIVYGKLCIGTGALVLGSIKAYGGIRLETGVTIRGALVSIGRIVCGIKSVVDGPLISESTVLVGPGSRIGSANQPTSVSAPVIKFYAPNTIAYGTLWARVRGTAAASKAAA
jgi:hypothetical protein